MNQPQVNPKVKVGNYRHYKGGEYEVLSVGLDSETLRQVVIYKSKDTGITWVRDEEMFIEDIEYNGKTVPRFTFLD